MPKLPATPKTFEVPQKFFHTAESLPIEDGTEFDEMNVPSFAVTPDPAESTAARPETES